MATLPTSNLLTSRNLGNDPDQDSDSFLAAHPFAWIFVPLLAFLILSILLTIYYRRRRALLHARFAEGGPAAVQRDLESNLSGAQGMRGPRFHGYVRGNHWQQWRAAETGRRHVGNARPPRREEGLNELGEAPPPYEGRKSEERGASMELHDIDLRRPDAATMAGGAKLPGYDEARNGDTAQGSRQPDANVGGAVAQPSPVLYR